MIPAPHYRLLLALTLLAPVSGCAKAVATSDTTTPAVASPTIGPDTKAEVAKVVEPDGAQPLQRFASTRELSKYLEEQASKSPYGNGYGQGYGAIEESEAGGMVMDAPMAGEPMPAPSPEPSAAPADGAKADDESITNSQEQGVDEGGIVKTHGNHLVVLRRGRLFTVDMGRKSLRPIASLSVSPGAGHDAWYDEMLIHDDTIVIVGFSYQANATEIGLFDIDAAGGLRHRDTFFLRSNDY